MNRFIPPATSSHMLSPYRFQITIMRDREGWESKHDKLINVIHKRGFFVTTASKPKVIFEPWAHISGVQITSPHICQVQNGVWHAKLLMEGLGEASSWLKCWGEIRTVQPLSFNTLYHRNPHIMSGVQNQKHPSLKSTPNPQSILKRVSAFATLEWRYILLVHQCASSENLTCAPRIGSSAREKICESASILWKRSTTKMTSPGKFSRKSQP